MNVTDRLGEVVFFFFLLCNVTDYRTFLCCFKGLLGKENLFGLKRACVSECVLVKRRVACVCMWVG